MENPKNLQEILFTEPNIAYSNDTWAHDLNVPQFIDMWGPYFLFSFIFFSLFPLFFLFFFLFLSLSLVVFNLTHGKPWGVMELGGRALGSKGGGGRRGNGMPSA